MKAAELVDRELAVLVERAPLCGCDRVQQLLAGGVENRDVAKVSPSQVEDYLEFQWNTQ